MDALITGTTPGKLVDDIPCYIEFAEEPIYLHIEADIKGPEAVIQEAGLDFGLVQIGDIAKSYMTIENISNLPLKWSLSCSEHTELFEFPPEGTLQPLETMRVEVIFMPTSEIILNNQFDISIENGNVISCNCYAQVQRSNASFLESQVYADGLYLNVETIAIAKLCNHSVLQTEFKFGKPEGPDCETTKVRVEPSVGVLNGKSLLECKLHITPSELGDLPALLIPCYIKDMEYPIFIEVSGTVKGVSVNYYYTDTTDPFDFDCPKRLDPGESGLDFGSHKVGRTANKSLIIQNNSGINTSISLDVKRFKSQAKTDKNDALFCDPMVSQRRDIKDHFKLANSELGLGFVINKSQFELPAFGLVKFTISTLSEIWGDYEDCLMVRYGEEPRQVDEIGLRVSVTDSPIRFFSTMIPEDDGEIAMLRFGNQTLGSSNVIKRNLKLQNTSSIPIQIDWRVFIVDQADRRIIDLNVVYDDINEADLMKIAGIEQNSNRSSSKLIATILRVRRLKNRCTNFDNNSK